MCPRSIDELEAELEQLQQEEINKLAEKASLYAGLKGLAAEVKTATSKAGADLLQAMSDQGLTNLVAGPVRIGITQRATVGIAEGQNDEEHIENREAARAWVEKYNPQTTSITTTTLKQTLEAMLTRDGADAPVPSFIKQQDVPTLSVRRG